MPLRCMSTHCSSIHRRQTPSHEQDQEAGQDQEVAEVEVYMEENTENGIREGGQGDGNMKALQDPRV